MTIRKLSRTSLEHVVDGLSQTGVGFDLLLLHLLLHPFLGSVAQFVGDFELILD